jgi:hypothetical protein
MSGSNITHTHGVPALPPGQARIPPEALEGLAGKVGLRKVGIEDRMAPAKKERSPTGSGERLSLEPGRDIDTGKGKIPFPPPGPGAYAADECMAVFDVMREEAEAMGKEQIQKMQQYSEQAMQAATSARDATYADASSYLVQAITSGVTALGSLGSFSMGLRASRGISSKIEELDARLGKLTSEGADEFQVKLKSAVGQQGVDLDEPAQDPAVAAAAKQAKTAARENEMAKIREDRKLFSEQAGQVWMPHQMAQQTLSSFASAVTAAFQSMYATQKGNATFAEQAANIASQIDQQQLSQFADAFAASIKMAEQDVEAFAQIIAQYNQTSQKIAG